MVDCLLNAFINIIYITLAGGLISLEPKHLRAIPGAGRGVESAGRRPVGAPSGRPRPGSGPPAPAPAGSPWRIVAAPWDGRSSRTGGCTRRSPPGGRPSTCSTPSSKPIPAPTTYGGGGAIAPTTWPGCGPITPIRPAATRLPPCRWPSGRWTLAPTPRPTGTRWGSRTTAPATTTRRSPPSIAPEPWAAARPSTTSSWPWRSARLGDPAEARLALARAMLRAERDYPGHPELAAFCDEARSILAGDTRAPLAIR